MYKRIEFGMGDVPKFIKSSKPLTYVCHNLIANVTTILTNFECQVF